MRAHLATFLALLSWMANTSAQDIPAFVKGRHQLPLRAYLASHPYYYIAPESLCQCDDDLSWLRKQEPLFQPYYAVGDINDDGIEDFAVGLLDNRKAVDKEPMLTLVIFHGPFSKRKIPKGITLFENYRITGPEEILSVFKTRVENGYRYPARLDLGPSPFGSDNNWAIIYDWKAKKYVIR
jgi:hypothetical protein